MHTIECPNGTRIHFNGDCSGNVEVCRTGEGLIVPAEDLLYFAGCIAKRRAIAEIEDIDPVDMLGKRR